MYRLERRLFLELLNSRLSLVVKSSKVIRKSLVYTWQELGQCVIALANTSNSSIAVQSEDSNAICYGECAGKYSGIPVLSKEQGG